MKLGCCDRLAEIFFWFDADVSLGDDVAGCYAVRT
jgi:hypothetical protein